MYFIKLNEYKFKNIFKKKGISNKKRDFYRLKKLRKLKLKQVFLQISYKLFFNILRKIIEKKSLSLSEDMLSYFPFNYVEILVPQCTL